MGRDVQLPHPYSVYRTDSRMCTYFLPMKLFIMNYGIKSRTFGVFAHPKSRKDAK